MKFLLHTEYNAYTFENTVPNSVYSVVSGVHNTWLQTLLGAHMNMGIR